MTQSSSSPILSDPELQNEDPIESHILGPIYNDDGTKITGPNRLMEAMVNGTPVTALCGYTWVPSRDPKRHPICPRCKAIIERTPDGSS